MFELPINFILAFEHENPGVRETIIKEGDRLHPVSEHSAYLIHHQEHHVAQLHVRICEPEMDSRLFFPLTQDSKKSALSLLCQ